MERSRGRSSRLVLQERDRRLVADVFLHRAMSRDQIRALGYFTSVQRTNARLLGLVADGWLRRLRPALYTGQNVYAAGSQSVALLPAALDADPETVARLVRTGITELCLRHTLRIVDLRIALQSYRLGDGYRLLQWNPELLCRHEYKLEDRQGEWQAHVLRPDGYARLGSDAEDFDFFLEADLGNVSQSRFANKIQSYSTYLESGVFEEIYGRETFGVLVVTTGKRRLSSLQRLTNNGSPMFLFSTFDQLESLGAAAPIWSGTNGDQTLAEIVGCGR